MERVLLKNLASEMTIADDLLGRDGRLLLKVGAVLTEKHIRAMKIWGIPYAYIKVGEEIEADDKVAQQKAGHTDTIPTELLGKFKLANMDHPLIKELFEQAVKRYEQ